MISTEKRVPFYSTAKDHFNHLITGISNQSHFSQLTANQIVLQHVHTLLIEDVTIATHSHSTSSHFIYCKVQEERTIMSEKGNSFVERASESEQAHRASQPYQKSRLATASVSSSIRVEKVGW